MAQALVCASAGSQKRSLLKSINTGCMSVECFGKSIKPDCIRNLSLTKINIFACVFLFDFGIMK